MGQACSCDCGDRKGEVDYQEVSIFNLSFLCISSKKIWKIIRGFQNNLITNSSILTTIWPEGKLRTSIRCNRVTTLWIDKRNWGIVLGSLNHTWNPTTNSFQSFQTSQAWFTEICLCIQITLVIGGRWRRKMKLVKENWAKALQTSRETVTEGLQLQVKKKNSMSLDMDMEYNTG